MSAADPTRTADDVYAEFLRRREAGEEITFEAFCAELPEMAVALRLLHSVGGATAAPGQESVERALKRAFGGVGPLGEAGPREEAPRAGPASPGDALPDPCAAGPAGRRYVVEREVARGGMGVIYRVWDEDLKRPLAMKVMLPGPSAPGGAEASARRGLLERFLHEARITGQLEHPGVVPVHELGADEEGRVFFVMPLVEGSDLRAVFKAARESKEGWTPTRALGVLARVCDTLAYAHSKGVIHRDLKPANVMVGRFGEAYVMDWGLAKARGSQDLRDLRLRVGAGEVPAPGASPASGGAPAPDSPLVTMDGTVLGTPAYMPPEQAAGRIDEIDERSDVYSVGAMLYTLLTGRVPYSEGEGGATPSPREILEAVLRGLPRPVHAIDCRAPAELVAICEKAMARSKGARYPSIGAMRDDLEAYLENRVVRAHRTGARAELRKWVSRNRGTAASIAGALTVAAAASLGVILIQASAGRSLSSERDAKDAALREKTAALEAESQALVRAEGLRLTARSAAVLPADPALALLVAIEGARRAPGLLATNALVEALASLREERTLLGHGGTVSTGAFSPDGSRVFTASWDGMVRVWDAGSGEEVLRLVGPCAAVQWAAWSPDGARLASGCFDPVVRVWDAASGKQLFALEGQKGPIEHVAFSPDGTKVASGGRDAKACVWSAETGRLLATLSGHGGWVLGVDFSPDGRLLATASQDETARLWDASTGAPLQVLRGHSGGVDSAAFDPAGRRLVTASQDGTARVWDAGTGKEIAAFTRHRGRVLAARFSPEGARVLSASSDGTARIWSGESGEELAVLRGHGDQVSSARFSPDGRRVLTASNDRTARLWDAAGGTELAVLRGHRGNVRWAAFSPDGRRAITTSEDGTARLWDAACAAEEAALNRARGSALEGGRAAVLSPDLKRVAVLGGKAAAIHDAATWKELARLEGHESAIAAADFSPDGLRVATASLDDTARVWDAATGREIAVLRGHTNRVRSARFSPDGSKVATSSYDHTGGVWDVESGRRLHVLGGHGWVEDARFGPGGDLVATVSADGTARLWDPSTGAHLRTLRHGEWLHASAFSPDGRRFLTASLVWIVLWDVATGERLTTLEAYEGALLRAAFSAGGERLATLHSDGAARLWDLARRETFATLRARRGNFVSVTFEEDGSAVSTVEEDGAERRWPLDPLAAALERKPRELVWRERVHAEIGTSEERAQERLRRQIEDLRLEVRLARRQAEADPARGEARSGHARIAAALAETVLANPLGRERLTAGSDPLAREALGEAARFLEEVLEHPGAPVELEASLEGLRQALHPDLASYAGVDAAFRRLDRADLVRAGASWRRFAGPREPSPGLEWTEPGFDDAAWGAGPLAGGRQPASELSGPTALYYRCRFTADRPGRFLRCDLKVSVLRRAAGFAAYLNAREVARFNAGLPGVPLPATAVPTRNLAEPLPQVTIAIDAGRIREGENVLALQAFVRDARDLEHALSPALVGIELPDPQEDERLRSELQKVGGQVKVGGQDEVGGQDKVGGPVAAARRLYLDARLLARRGRHREAAAKLLEVLALDPSSLEPACRLVESLRAAGDGVEADRRLRELLEKAPPIPEDDTERLYQAGWGILHSPHRDLDACVRAYLWARRARELAPARHDFPRLLGAAQHRLGLWEDAVATLGLAQALYLTTRGHGHPVYAAFLAMSCHELGRAEEARRAIEGVRALLRDERWRRAPYVAIWVREAEALVAAGGREPSKGSP
ncbi:MAG: protein kinase [Planctomycetes bacterium]|nr:protein kinase [Planctomycetota bacterium]